MISKHLKDAVDRFTSDSASIAPICETDASIIDASIIDALITIFNLTAYKELGEILEDYKKLPDQEVLYNLNLWIKNGSIAHKTMIRLGEVEFNLQFLQTISQVDSYDSVKKRPTYKLILNQDSSEKLFFANTEIVFYSEDARDSALSDFKQKTKYLQIKYI